MRSAERGAAAHAHFRLRGLRWPLLKWMDWIVQIFRALGGNPAPLNSYLLLLRLLAVVLAGNSRSAAAFRSSIRVHPVPSPRNGGVQAARVRAIKIALPLINPGLLGQVLELRSGDGVVDHDR